MEKRNKKIDYIEYVKIFGGVNGILGKNRN